MTLAAVSYPLLLPNPGLFPSPSQGSLTMDAAAEKAAMIFPVMKSGTIEKVAIRTGTVTDSQTLKVSLQALDSSGHPDGTILSSTNAYGTIASPASNTRYEVTLGATYAATRDEGLAVVVEFDSTDGNLIIISLAAYMDVKNFYVDAYTGAWAKQAGRYPLVDVIFDDGSFMPGVSATIHSNASFSAASNPDERGNVLMPAVPMRAIGIWAFGVFTASTEFVLYNSSGTALATATSVVGMNGNAGTGVYAFPFPDGDDIELTAGSTYRVIVKPGATSVSLVSYTMSSATNRLIMPFGNEMYYTSQNDGGGFTDDTSVIAGVGIIVDQLDDGAGGGGSGDTGGLRRFNGGFN